MDRRHFIKLTAVTGASTALASCGNPEHQLIRFIPDDDLVPGVAEWKPAACPLCQAGCGMVVRVMEGDAEVVRDKKAGVVKMALAKKLEGNPAHPVSQGALCVRGQAAIQITYHPDRVRQPLKRSGERGTGQFREVTWDEAIAEVVAKLDALAAANDQKSVAWISRRTTSQRLDLAAQFLERFGSPSPMTFELFGDDVLRRANGLSFGREQLPTFDLGRSRHVLSFGADFLGTWNSPVAQNAGYGQMRQGRTGLRAKFVQVEPRMSQTGANADEWVPVRPGTEGVLALGLAHVIIAAKLRPADAGGRAGALIEGWSGGLARYTPKDVEKVTGVTPKRIERLARELVENRPAAVVIGGAPLAQTNGLFQALAVNALNALLGSVGEQGGLLFTPQPSAPRVRPDGGRALQKLASDIVGGKKAPVQALFLDGANPVYGTPTAWRIKDALRKVPFIVSFGSFIDDTSAFADLILPDHSFLESWSDSRAESGSSVAVVTVAAPAMRPLHATRATPDVVFDIASRLKRPVTLPWKKYDEMLQATVASLAASPAAADETWSQARKQGGWWGQDAGRRSAKKDAPREASARQGAKGPVEPTFDGDPGQFPFHFLPYASQAFLDGSTSHLPWLQELPDVVSTAMWSSWVEINPKTAARLKIEEGDVVEVASSQGTLRAPALVSPGIAPDVIAMPVGQGHVNFTRYASGRGENPVKLLAPVSEPETGALAWAATRVKVSRVSGPDGRLILFAGSKHEHPDLARG